MAAGTLFQNRTYCWPLGASYSVWFTVLLLTTTDQEISFTDRKKYLENPK